MKSKVIVLILGYNDLNNLKECLDSVEDQDYSNFEVYFADNNSIIPVENIKEAIEAIY